MGAPHNPKRYGETWDPEHLAALGQEIEAIKDSRRGIRAAGPGTT